MKTWIMALLLMMDAAAEESGRLTLALSPEFMTIHDERLGPLPRHVLELKDEVDASSFKVLCLGEKRIGSYDDKRFREGRFVLWIAAAKPLVEDSLAAKDKAGAGCESTIAGEKRLFDGKDAGKETMVILDWPCQREGEVPGLEAFADPHFALAIPEASGEVPLRGDVYWYFSQAVLESSLGKMLEGKDAAAKERETERCRQALARMWATYLRSKGFRLMAFDAEVPGEGRLPRNLATILQADRAANQEVAPYDLKAGKKPVIEPAKPAPAPGAIRVFIEWEGRNVVLPVYRGRRGGEAVFPAAATEIPDESQSRVFKDYRAFVSEDGEEIEALSGSLRYRGAIKGSVTHSRELEIPIGEDGRARGKLQLYLYDGTVRSAEGFPVYVRKGDRKSPPIQTLVFRNVEGQRENGRTSDSDNNYWKTIELNN
ncbi:hypothetical protein [Luteolibacter sp. Populi]|uniref:hypothetical protein n=1 Tax=Luteolibacter sp. Populi TaxID=3230487 RepID=UPI00346712AD